MEVLNQQCYRYLYSKLEKSRKAKLLGPIAAKNASQASSKEVLTFISELGISNIQLKVEDIESILNTLVYDGKVEKTYETSGSDNTEVRLYRAVDSLIGVTGLMRTPCGGCPVRLDCSLGKGSITPSKCGYLKEWLSM